MNFFKKLFSRKNKSKAKKQEDECWYNNAHEKAESNLGEPLENVVSPNRAYYTTSFDSQNH